MSLLNKEIDELKVSVQVNNSFSLDSLQPDVTRVESKYILKILGKVLYDKVVAVYTNPPDPPGTTEQQNNLKLVPYVQMVIGPLALAMYSAINQVQISDSGWRRVEDGNSKTAYSGQITDVKEYLWERGLEAIEDLYQFLEDNNGDYPDWTGDAQASSLNKQLMINSSDEITEYYALVSPRRTYLALQPIIKRLEELFVKPAISTDLYTEIKTEIASGSLSEDNIALMKLLKPALIFQTLADALEMLPIRIEGSSILLLERMTSGSNDHAGSRPGELTMENLGHSFGQQSEAYLNQSKDLLLAEASDSKYAAFFNSDLYPADGEDPDDRTYVNPPDNKMFGAF